MAATHHSKLFAEHWCCFVLDLCQSVSFIETKQVVNIDYHCRTFPSFRRREARWFAASISSSLKSSRAPSPPPSFEFPPSYSSCFTHSCSNIHSITTYHSLSSNHHLRIINNNQPSPLSIRSNPPPKYTSRAPSRAASRDDISRAPSPARSLADSIELSSSCRSVPKDDVIKA